jgi:hypothetical protein
MQNTHEWKIKKWNKFCIQILQNLEVIDVVLFSGGKKL